MINNTEKIIINLLKIVRSKLTLIQSKSNEIVYKK